MNRTQLVEIKKGNVGTGLLLENDGYMSLDMPDNKMLKESVDEFKNGMAHELPRPFVVSAVFQKYGIQNANGRVYPEAILKREVEKYQQAIKERRAFGECEHPDDSNINLERVCMNIIELHWEGHTLVGKMEIPLTEGFRRYGICSDMGDKIAQRLIDGLRIGVSSRALGSVQQIGGHLVVQEDMDLIAFDVVSTNSTPGAIIRFEESELQPFIESKVENSGKEMIKEDKYTKFDNWLNG